MATTKILIRESKKNSQGKCTVYIQYCHNEKTALFSTSVKVIPDGFDAKNGKVRKGVTGFTSMNSLITKKEGEVIRTYSDLMLKDIDPTIDEVRNIMKGEKREKKDNRLLILFEEYAKDKKNIIRKSTARHFPVTLGKLKTFLKAEGLENITIEKMNFNLLEKFNFFLLKTLAPGSANNHLKRLKSFLQKKYYSGEYKSQDFKNTKLNEDKVRDQKKIFLTDAELTKLKIKAMPNERLEKVKDLFILACCTGLRFSDLSSLRKEHIHNDVISITTIKTGKPLEIPLFLYAKEIIEKYNGDLPKISNQKMNDYIKEVCQIAEIDNKIIIPTWRGKDRKDEVFNKYDLISSHTGKKTFVMLCVAAGVDIHRVASITGNDVKTLKHYYDIETSEKVRSLKGVEEFYNKMQIS